MDNNFSYLTVDEKIIHECDHEINKKLGGFKVSESLLDVSDDSFISCLTINAWDAFYSIYKSNRELLDKNTYFNRKFLGDRILFTKENFLSDEIGFLYRLIRVLFEFFFILNDPSMTPECVDDDVIEKTNFLVRTKDKRYNFLWIERSMPASIARDIMQDTQIIKIRDDILIGCKDINNSIKKHEAEIDSYAEIAKLKVGSIVDNAVKLRDDVITYEGKLQEYKKEYNFVLLSKTFNNIRSTKKRELIFAYIRFSVSVLLLISIPIYLYATRDVHSVTQWSDVFVYAPLITLELLFFYFMRLFYLEIKNTKSQILQIDMRLSLCEFIHDYVEKRESSDKSDNAWKSFEALIFSPIQSSEDKIPAVLDGADAIAELAGKIMGRKPQS